jgi:nitrite reductase/ring-hydroxylating ferredoxin subunit
VQIILDGFSPLCAYRVNGGVYITEDTCTHSEVSLAEEGHLVDFHIVCTRHDGEFDIRTGEATRDPCFISLQVYSALERDNGIFVMLPGANI